MSFQLKGSADLGYYTVDVDIGNPPQTVALILDTGSNSLIVPCKGCTKCNSHINQTYNPENSKCSSILKDGQKNNVWNCQFPDKDGKCSFT